MCVRFWLELAPTLGLTVGAGGFNMSTFLDTPMCDCKCVSTKIHVHGTRCLSAYCLECISVVWFNSQPLFIEYLLWPD